MVRKTNTKTKKTGRPQAKSREQSLVYNCTSCAQPQLLVQGKRNILCHPQLQVGVCRECLIFAHSDITPLDEEGYEIYCRWCSELGNLVCCDDCKAPFCEECISRNIGQEYYMSLSDVEEWSCFICEPTGVEDLRELTKAALDHQNYHEPSELLLEKCSAIFKGDPDLNDSDREDIVKERLRLRKNNLNETMSKKKKAAEEEQSDEETSEEDGLKVEEDQEESSEPEEQENKKQESEEQESEEEEDKKQESEEQEDKQEDKQEDIQEEEEEENKAKARGKKKKVAKSKSDDSDSLPEIDMSDVKEDQDPPRLSTDSAASEEEEEEPIEKSKSKKKKRKAKKEDSDSSDLENNSSRRRTSKKMPKLTLKKSTLSLKKKKRLRSSPEL